MEVTLMFNFMIEKVLLINLFLISFKNKNHLIFEFIYQINVFVIFTHLFF